MHYIFQTIPPVVLESRTDNNFEHTLYVTVLILKTNDACECSNKSFEGDNMHRKDTWCRPFPPFLALINFRGEIFLWRHSECNSFILMKHIEDFGAKHLQQYSKLFRIFFFAHCKKRRVFETWTKRNALFWQLWTLCVQIFCHGVVLGGPYVSMTTDKSILKILQK